MKTEIEQVMLHWGEQLLRHGAGGGMSCPLAAAVDWRGSPPRGTPGPVILVAGAGIDLVASEVDAALGEIERQGHALEEAAVKAGRPKRAVEGELVRLARARYLALRRPSIEQQMRDAGISGRRTYDRRLAELHERVEIELRRRVSRRAA